MLRFLTCPAIFIGLASFPLHTPHTQPFGPAHVKRSRLPRWILTRRYERRLQLVTVDLEKHWFLARMGSFVVPGSSIPGISDVPLRGLGSNQVGEDQNLSFGPLYMFHCF
ncbi:hypothetical protein F4861DRAFT_218422 [Xylaria intraflava]|nr:hypothetical protein F4861DRAFT_218422 [Xylaria intraflava]